MTASLASWQTRHRVYCIFETNDGVDLWDYCDGIVVSRFRYAAEPLCVISITLYLLAKVLVLPDWMNWWLTDLLFLPAAIPFYLWLERRSGLRNNDFPPTWREVLVIFVIWSFAAEVGAPLFFKQCTADPLDVVAYAIGGIVAGLSWSNKANKPPENKADLPASF